MGNATSDADGKQRRSREYGQTQLSDAFTQAAQFKTELGEMQRALQTLHVSSPAPLLPHQLAIDEVVVSCNPGVRVLVGPVVGKVDFESARVLMEVSARARVTCHVSTINALTNEIAELAQCRCVLSFEAQQPAVFRIERLSPGREYRISFSGIRREDAGARRGSFRTPTLETGESGLQVVAVSGDDPADLQAGERSVWRCVRERVEHKTVDCVLHLGGQVAMKRMFDYASLLLFQHGSSLSRSDDGAVNWQRMEARAVDVLRGAYRTQWSLSSDLQFVLANASNLMIGSDADMYPLFTTRKEFYIDHDRPTLQMQVIRTVTRCARRLYHEYQRQLWDDDMELVFKREAEMFSVAESALESSGKFYKLSMLIPKVAQDLEQQKQRREIEGARRVEKQLRALEAEKLKLEKQLVSYNQLLVPQRGEEFVYSIGAITVLLLDMRSARLEPGGSQAADNPMLSPIQWDFIERTLEKDGTRLLIVCTELPVADEDLADRSNNTEGCRNNPSAWRNNSEAQARLLSFLFDWKLERPNRKFMLLSGSGQFGTLSAKTIIKDTKLRTESIQYIVSSITAGTSVDDISIPLVGSAKSTISAPRTQAAVVIHDRFTVEHACVDADKKGFAVLAFKCGVDTMSPVAQVEQVHGSVDDDIALARVVLGPVVGWVDHHSATILLEVDRDVDLACVVDNPFTGERRRFFQHLYAYRPNSFHLTRLRSEHFYQVSFSSIQCPSDFRASFTTMSLSPEKFEVVALCNDASLLSANALTANSGTLDTSLWQILAEQMTGVPFSTVNLTLHLGGQFFPDTSAYVNEALLMADELCQDRKGLSMMLDDQFPALARISDKLRELYRLSWTVPAVREQLASGAHIFLINQNDLLPPSVASSSAGMLVQRLLRQVHHEYLDLLLPPIMRRSETVPRIIAHHFGTIGVFVLPVRSSEDNGLATFIEPTVWVDLDAVLANEKMKALVLITTEPVVRDSPTDIMEQAKLHSFYRSQFGFHQRDLDKLLGTLFRWQQSNQPPPGQFENSSVPSTDRRVILLSGDHCQSFDSIIQESNSFARVVPLKGAASSEDASTQVIQSSEIDKASIRQFIVGPLFAPPPTMPARKTSSRPLVFLEGSFFSKFTYKHSRVLCELDASTGLDQAPAELLINTSEQMGDTSLDMKQANKLSDRPSRCQFLRISLSVTGPTHNCSQLTSTTDSCENCHLVISRFVSRDPVKPRVQVDHKSQANEECSRVCVTYDSITASLADDDSTASILTMSLPKWLLEIMLQSLTTDEQEHMDERAELLRSKADAISIAFEQSSELGSGVLSLSLDPRGFIAELTHLFAEFYSQLAGPALQEKFLAPPSWLAIRLVLYRLLIDPRGVPLTSGAIDKAFFEHLLTRCYLDGWLLSRRLTEMFIETRKISASARQETSPNNSNNCEEESRA